KAEQTGAREGVEHGEVDGVAGFDMLAAGVELRGEGPVVAPVAAEHAETFAGGAARVHPLVDRDARGDDDDEQRDGRDEEIACVRPGSGSVDQIANPPEGGHDDPPDDRLADRHRVGGLPRDRRHGVVNLLSSPARRGGHRPRLDQKREHARSSYAVRPVAAAPSLAAPARYSTSNPSLRMRVSK